MHKLLSANKNTRVPHFVLIVRRHAPQERSEGSGRTKDTMEINLRLQLHALPNWGPNGHLLHVDSTASMDFFGWVAAACSLGCALANPLFGLWNQRTGSTKIPVSFGFTICAIGNLLYALLPIIPSNSKFVMLLARFLTGFGAGTLGVLRSFIATASTRASRMRAVSLGTAGITTGLSIGPAIQICFVPLGNTGFFVGPFLFNMYTTAAYFMFAVNVVSVFLVHAVFVEDYVGIISDDEKKEDPFLVIPKFDRVPVLLLFYMWWMLCGIASTEGLAAPITIAMYNWTDEEAILYNGVVQVISCLVSTLGYTIIGSTRIGKWDRRLVLAVGLLAFWYCHFFHYPLPFYTGPLTRPHLVNGTAIGGGGCSIQYEWCEYTPRVPMALYLFNFAVIQGFAYPLVSAPSNTLLSEILGPRKQGTVQGLFAFTGSMAQFIVPIFSTALFEVSGYKYIMVYHLVIITLAALTPLVVARSVVERGEELVQKPGEEVALKSCETVN
nr:Major facilitator superfamily MFS-1 domain containing protein [Haemonchus contortus]